jgi:peptide/nickel transport system permease protein
MNRHVRVLGTGLAVAIVGVAALAPVLTRYEPGSQSVAYVYAPPMPPRLFDETGLRWPFVYPVRLADRLERRYIEDRARPMPIRFFREGRLLSVDPAPGAEWFPLGTDALGRDQLTRLAWGARYSLGVALLAALGALLIGTAIGGVAGTSRGLLDDGLMRLSDFIVALPALYVVLAFRAALPLSLTTTEVFWTIVLVLAAVGWPVTARVVRAIVSVEDRKEYAEAARALGAGRTQILLRHLLPAAASSLAAQTTLLVPAFILAESTLSFVGLGFGEPTPSWGAMLRDAGSGRMLLEAPWLLAPALAIVLATLAVNLITGTRPPAELRTTAR